MAFLKNNPPPSPSFVLQGFGYKEHDWWIYNEIELNFVKIACVNQLYLNFINFSWHWHQCPLAYIQLASIGIPIRSTPKRIFFFSDALDLTINIANRPSWFQKKFRHLFWNNTLGLVIVSCFRPSAINIFTREDVQNYYEEMLQVFLISTGHGEQIGGPLTWGFGLGMVIRISVVWPSIFLRRKFGKRIWNIANYSSNCAEDSSSR